MNSRNNRIPTLTLFNAGLLCGYEYIRLDENYREIWLDKKMLPLKNTITKLVQMNEQPSIIAQWACLYDF